MKLYFLAGLPRSGSTLLGALLTQRSDMQVSATSGLISIMGAAAATWETLPQTRSGDAPLEAIYPILRGMIENYYQDHTRIALDKSRGWPDPKIMATMSKVLGYRPKIIATVRQAADCLASFMRIAKCNDAPKQFIRTSPLAQHFFHSYNTLKSGYEAEPENFLFIDYDELISEPQKQCDRVARFLQLPTFLHTLHGLSNPVPENDEKTWGIPDLHFVRPNIERSKYNPRDILGDKLWKFYQGGEFWKDCPEPEQQKGVLDEQLEAGLHGDFDKGWEYCKLAAEDDNRAQFNKGWYLMRRGQLSAGIALLDRGREDGIIGHPPRSKMPIWNGQKLNGQTVILQGECGLGDQIIHSRFARDIAARGGRVVLACHPDLAPVLSTIDGVSAVVQWTALGAIYHQYYIPAMSAARILGYEYRDLDGSAYIRWPSIKRNNKRKRVGICWRGDPKMQHDEYRQFDPQPLFDLPGVELISLQKNWDGNIPHYIKRPSLQSWQDTACVIASLDLVITSCTAVAHLAAAMGRPTWVLVPILPYYIWALPGNTSPWYDSVRLFRQTQYKRWSETFNELNTAFKEWNAQKNTNHGSAQRRQNHAGEHARATA